MTALTVLAHGVGERGDLPLPLWLFAYGAGGAVVVSFAALGLLWRRSRLEEEHPGRLLPDWLQVAARSVAVPARVAALVLYVAVVVAALAGDESTSFNLAPIVVYIWFWVAVQAASALLGDVWRVLNPLDTLAAAGSWFNRRVLGRTTEPRPDPGWGRWPAVAGLFGFVWLELVYVDPGSPRVLGVAIVVYSVAMLAAAARWGRGWLREGDAFAAWFGLLAKMAPFHTDEAGRLRVRPPLTGLTGIRVVPGTVPLIVVALGSTSFDGFTRIQFWTDLVGTRTGWEVVPLATAGLVWLIAVVGAAYAGSMRVAARLTGRDHEELVRWFAHSLIPIAFAYVVAHYFSLLVLDGQDVWRLLSDPLGRGWDLFGTASYRVNYTLVSTTFIAWVQAGAIVLGHVAGVLMAHDRAVARFDGEEVSTSQYPLLAAMVLYTVGGLAILLGV